MRQQTAPGGNASVGAPARAAAVASAASRNTLGMLRSIFVKEGVPGLYAGVSAPLLAVIPSFTIMFWSYEKAKSVQLDYTNKKYGRADKEPSISQVAIAGGFSGIPLALVLGPLERMKCLMQVDKSRFAGFGDCARQVYREGGLRSVFRGTTLTIARDIPGNAAYFATYESIRRTLSQLEQTYSGRPQHQPSVAATLLAGGTAGIMNWIVAIPIDVIKSRWQTAAPGMYNNAFEVLRHLMQTEGPAALFKGLSPALLRAFPANAACLLGFETAKSFLSFAQNR